MTRRPDSFLLLDARGDARVAFLGRADDRERERVGAREDLDTALDRLRSALGEAAPERGAESRQVHSARCSRARVGTRPEGDALFTGERDLALAVYTADCVPVLFAGPTAVAAAHAGWRGLVAGVLAATLDGLPDPPSTLTAWIGPAIGGCCYEVSEEVAHAVARSAGSRARIERSPRPHADLCGAARAQLGEAGVQDVRLFAHCTRCESGKLWSYRGHGATGRRNYSLIWRESR